MDKQLLLTILKPAHGLFNILVLTLFLWQGWMGLMIRRARLAGEATPFAIVKRHRGIGPIAAMLAIAGYLAGISLVLYDKGTIFEHPLHLAVGSVLITALAATVALSRMIKGTMQSIRAWHFRLGIVTLILFIAEVFFGLEVLF